VTLAAWNVYARIGLGCILLVPAVWVMHSVKKYFGFARALGGDHFFERYRTMPMVRAGAFKHTSNAMYGIAFFGLWGPGFSAQLTRRARRRVVPTRVHLGQLVLHRAARRGGSLR
jgi:hypothetical protein